MKHNIDKLTYSAWLSATCRRQKQKVWQALTDPARPHERSLDSDGSMGTVGAAKLTWAPNGPPKAAQNL
jgi:hypothetical protein